MSDEQATLKMVNEQIDRMEAPDFPVYKTNAGHLFLLKRIKKELETTLQREDNDCS